MLIVCSACEGRKGPYERRNGSLNTLSYLGAQKTIPNYNVMGLGKASLEASVRFLALLWVKKVIELMQFLLDLLRLWQPLGLKTLGKCFPIMLIDSLGEECIY
ncbi:MAG: hypothetical protein CM1200mP12_07450 [Gammaproteobacteria bacterium]|nr:MAG: hypothetical protein CM1200mP12_07450 [Gammaproteobacteria bacterium]